MNRDQCIKALAEHANVRPLVTLTGRSASLLYANISVDANHSCSKLLFCFLKAATVLLNWVHVLQCGGSYKRRTRTSFKHISMLSLPGLSQVRPRRQIRFMSSKPSITGDHLMHFVFQVDIFEGDRGSQEGDNGCERKSKETIIELILWLKIS